MLVAEMRRKPSNLKRNPFDEQRRFGPVGTPPSLNGSALVRQLLRRHFLHNEFESVGSLCIVSLASRNVPVQPCDTPAIDNSDRFLFCGQRGDRREDAT